jgi:hypothetical protein
MDHCSYPDVESTSDYDRLHHRTTLPSEGRKGQRNACENVEKAVNHPNCGIDKGLKGPGFPAFCETLWRSWGARGRGFKSRHPDFYKSKLVRILRPPAKSAVQRRTCVATTFLPSWSGAAMPAGNQPSHLLHKRLGQATGARSLADRRRSWPSGVTHVAALGPGA